MANYLDTLGPQAKANAAVLLQRMKEKGITSPFTHAAILAVVSKESGFIPKYENMNYTTADSISRVFGLPLETAKQYVKKPKELGDFVYGPVRKPSLGNGVGEGYKYRGAGYNQLTGKANYKKYGQLVGVDLISNPDKMNDPKIAADVAIAFFKNGISSLASLGKLSQYNATNINDFKTAKDSLGAIYHVNAGTGHTAAHINADVTGGKAKAESRLDDLFNFVSGGVKDIGDTLQNNSGKIVVFFFVLSIVAGGIVLYNKAS